MTLEPIAYFKSPYPSKFGIPRQSGLVDELRGEIRFTGKFRNPDAIRGLEGFDFIWIIWEFSANRKDTSNDWKATVRPPRLGGNERLGVFATRSPFRPNPIGLSCVRIESIDAEADNGPIIHVLGADLMDGTPIFDIKPYIPYTDSHPEARSGFTSGHAWECLEVRIPDDVAARIETVVGEENMKALKASLSLDPRPRYHDDPEKEYGMPFCGLDILFKVKDGILTVTGYRPLK